MAETTQKTGAPRRGGSRAGRASAAKPAPSTAAVTDDGTTELYEVELIPMGETRTYSKWSPPDNSGCVGTFYAPLGAVGVTMKITGPSVYS